MVCQIRKPAPEFTCDAAVNGELTKVSLSDFKGKYVVLFFYPLDFTFICPTEICAFSDAAAQFEEREVQLLGMSVDSQFSHLAFSNVDRIKGGLGGCNFPLLSDITKEVSKAYDVYMEDGPDAGVSLRGLFIIDDKGILRQKTINDLPVGRNVEEVLRLVDAFKFTDEHGEVCPANWRPGAATMKADVTGSKAYFESLGSEAPME